MKTVAKILKKTKVGDILVAGRRRWKVSTKDYDGNGTVVAFPLNKSTTFELWSAGVESVAVIPGLKVKR